MIPKTHTPVHQAIGNTLAQMESLYTFYTALYICGTIARTGATSCVHEPGRSRSAWYNRFMIWKMQTPFHLAMGSSLAQMASLCTCCMAVYTFNNFARTGATSCEHKPETSRGTYYTRNTIPKTHMPDNLDLSSYWVQRGDNSCVRKYVRSHGLVH